MSSDVGARQPVVDLLIRNAGGGGYELRTFTAVESGLSFRPLPAPVDECEVNEVAGEPGGGKSYIVRHIPSGNIVRLSPQGYRVFTEIDGRATILDLVTSCFMSWGAIAPEEVWRTVRELRSAGLLHSRQADLSLIERPRSATRGAGLRRRLGALWHRVEFRLHDVDGLLRTLSALGGRGMFSPVSLHLSLAAIALGITGFVAQGAFGAAAGVVRHPGAAVGALLLIIGIVAAHELSHAVACTHFGRRVRSIGVTLWAQWLPMPYADVRDIWLASQNARTTVYFAGPYSSVVAASLLGLASWAMGASPAGYAAQAAAAGGFIIAALTAHPFLPVGTDGYQVLAAYAGCLDLRHEAWRSARRGLLWRAIRARGLSARERLLLLYLVAAVLSVGHAIIAIVALALACGTSLHTPMGVMTWP